jgi:cation diffusion facilitator CzcD-associated flavoprotein CzcO
MVADNPTKLDVVIVGAGLAGLYQLYKLQNELGLTARVLESAAGVGGTWFWNRYPGARCDILSLMYAYSFSPELAREWTWTEKYATQPEILSYIDHVADRFNLREDIALNTRVVRAAYNEDQKRWRVETEVVGNEAHPPGGNPTGNFLMSNLLSCVLH